MKDLPSTVLQDYCPVHRGACSTTYFTDTILYLNRDRRALLEEEMAECYLIQHSYTITRLHLQMG